MEPLTPGITMVAAAMTPITNRMIIWPSPKVMEASVPLPPPTIFRPTTSAKARTKAIAPGAPFFSHFDAAFEVLEQRIDAADDRVVNAHGNHHRAAAYAGDDVGQTDNHAAQNVKNRFHAFLHLKFRIDRGILPDKDCLYIKTVRCSFGGRVLRNIFFAIVSASAVFVNRFFENLTFAWRVCRSAQNIDVFAVG